MGANLSQNRLSRKQVGSVLGISGSSKVVLLGDTGVGKTVFYKQAVHSAHLSGFLKKHSCECSNLRAHIRRVQKHLLDLLHEAISQLDNEGENNSLISVLLTDIGLSLKKFKSMKTNGYISFGFLDNLFFFMERTNLEIDEYFKSRLESIFSDEYEPSFEDIVRQLPRTSGAFKSKFYIPHSLLKMDSSKISGDSWELEVVDIGGSKPDKRKWKIVLQDCKTILYVFSFTHFINHNFENVPALDAFVTFLASLDENINVFILINMDNNVNGVLNVNEEKIGVVKDVIESNLSSKLAEEVHFISADFSNFNDCRSAFKEILLGIDMET
eukprot:snap_masked-scaffold_17-processed-gene-3.9-mRNA-1 protein AED:1.00 eAED:1.00 QI:0/-1/0/0/-1/1/1/0/326